MINEKNSLDLLASDIIMIGYETANLVADKLEKGCFLGYRHRDYCGMAMTINEKQQFLYGELYDGTEFSVPMIFENRDSFVAWLSAQSTASMARLEAEDFFKGNQIITRQRLLNFIADPLCI